MTRRTCDLLGVCQQHTPACLGCDHHALAASVQASRDTGCCWPFGDDNETPTKAENVSYWLGVGATVGISVVALFGSAGYLFTKLI
jgi:hypothetical protein